VREATSIKREVLTLTHLVDKSLVEADAERERYRVETVRQYAEECLVESGEAESAYPASLFLSLAETARPELEGPDQGVAQIGSMSNARISVRAPVVRRARE
jgi:predicted ATPase